jgi:hypothetical protein
MLAWGRAPSRLKLGRLEKYLGSTRFEVGMA